MSFNVFAEELTDTYKLLHARSSMEVPQSHLEQLADNGEPGDAPKSRSRAV